GPSRPLPCKPSGSWRRSLSWRLAAAGLGPSTPISREPAALADAPRLSARPRTVVSTLGRLGEVAARREPWPRMGSITCTAPCSSRFDSALRLILGASVVADAGAAQGYCRLGFIPISARVL